MTAAAMESKRLGLCNKIPLCRAESFDGAVGGGVLAALSCGKYLVATKKDFEMKTENASAVGLQQATTTL